MPSAAQIRQQFIDFFVERHAHRFVPSSPVVPHDDPTLLFANAGMNQFKPAFLGEVAPGSPLQGLKRAANSQKCIRAGGKHNDLDDVGKDSYHHTFFEMLGNWSFGDYFKAEAIDWAWELLTGVWGIDPERLYATYFKGNRELGLDPDREAYELWLKHLPASRVIPGDMKDNFWEMGDTGPCGPCAEIHYDGRSDEERAAKPGYELVNQDHDNVVEIWNLVFIQFDRRGPTSLKPLPARHVDTGMGFERIARVLQGKTSNYDTDVFTPYFERIAQVCKAKAYGSSFEDPVDTAYRVIADHVRTLTVAIADGAQPGNTGREYVLRSILRRAVRYGRQVMGVEGAFLHKIVPVVGEQLGDVFPEVHSAVERAQHIIKDEEEAFGRTLLQGLALFEQSTGDRRSVTAEDAFKLHDTYGFPIDLTQQMATERGLTVDVEGFHRLMEEARERSRGPGHKGEHADLLLGTEQLDVLRTKWRIKPTDDSPKYEGRICNAHVRVIWNGTDFDTHINATNTRPADRFAVVLDRTNLYAEQGGQVADVGRLVDHRGGEFHLENVVRCGEYIVHIGRANKGEIRVGETLEVRRDDPRRLDIAANHTATHLLNYALRTVLGQHVDQKGSLVAPDRLRFDFSHTAPLSCDEIKRIESIVLQAIGVGHPVHVETLPLEQAKGIRNVRAVFGETYPDPVRVVAIGGPLTEMKNRPDDVKWDECSIEFCGGTHLLSAADAEEFAIVVEEAVSKGVRRVTALTREPARQARRRAEEISSRLSGAERLGDQYLAPEVSELQEMIEREELPVARRADLMRRLTTLQDRLKAARKQAAAAGKNQAIAAAKALAQEASGPFIVGLIPAGSDRGSLLAAMDTLRGNHPDAAILIASVDDDEGKVSIAAQVPKPLIEKGLKAGDWVRETSTACGGKGGGKPDKAQGGGTEPDKVDVALDRARAFAIEKLV